MPDTSAGLLERVTKALGAPKIFRMDFQGFVRDPARAFPLRPNDQVIDDTPPDWLAFRRLMLVGTRDEEGEITGVVQVSLGLMVQQNVEHNLWRIFAATDRPWTVALARDVIVGNLGDVEYFDNASTMGVPGTLLRLGPGNEDRAMVTFSNESNVAPTVLAHAPDQRTRRAHERILNPHLLSYRELVHFALYDDPDGKMRKHYKEHAFRDVVSQYREMPDPPLGGMCAVLPMRMNKDLIPKDLPLKLDKREAADPKIVAAWVERLAQLTVHPAWSQLRDAVEVVDANFRLKFALDLACDPAVGVMRQLDALNKAYDSLARLDKEIVEANDGLVADNGRRAEENLRLTASLDVERGHVRNLRAKVQALQNELAELRATGVERLRADLEARTAEVGTLRADLADSEEVAQILRRQIVAGREVPELAGPTSWRELFLYAGMFEYVDVPDSAVKPAYGVLDRGRESAGWLTRTWAVLTRLEEYAQAKARGERGPVYMNFKTYVYAFPSPGVTSIHVALGEQEQTARSRKSGGQRMFRTPLGELFVDAHFKLGSGKPPAPRLYFHDDTGGETGKVYVVYIGEHLMNTLTN